MLAGCLSKKWKGDGLLKVAGLAWRDRSNQSNALLLDSFAVDLERLPAVKLFEGRTLFGAQLRVESVGLSQNALFRFREPPIKTGIDSLGKGTATAIFN